MLSFEDAKHGVNGAFSIVICRYVSTPSRYQALRFCRDSQFLCCPWSQRQSDRHVGKLNQLLKEAILHSLLKLDETCLCLPEHKGHPIPMDHNHYPH